MTDSVDPGVMEAAIAANRGCDHGDDPILTCRECVALAMQALVQRYKARDVERLLEEKRRWRQLSHDWHLIANGWPLSGIDFDNRHGLAERTRTALIEDAIETLDPSETNDTAMHGEEEKPVIQVRPVVYYGPDCPTCGASPGNAHRDRSCILAETEVTDEEG